MRLTDYLSLGNSGLRVSPFCLGAMTFSPDWGFGADVDTSKQIIDRYLDQGGNFIDTANMYMLGRSEAVLGDHLGRDRARRDRVVLATKFGMNMYNGDPNGGGAGRKAIIESCEQSLRRLQTDYIDLYWLHWWDQATPIEETYRAMDDLVTSGKVRYLGFSDTPSWKVAEAQGIAHFRGWSPLIALQIEYSLLERTVEGELMPMARALGLGVTAWSPLKSGVLSGKYSREAREGAQPGRALEVEASLTEKAFEVIDILKTTAQELESTPARVALSWLRSRPGLTSPIIGARTLQQLDDNLAALDLELSPRQIETLDNVSRPTLNWPADLNQLNMMFSYGGLTVDGKTYLDSGLVPVDGKSV